MKAYELYKILGEVLARYTEANISLYDYDTGGAIHNIAIVNIDNDKLILTPKSYENEVNERFRLDINVESDISELGLSIRLCNILRRNNVYTIKDLAEKSQDDLLDMRGLGERMLEEIIMLLGAVAQRTLRDFPRRTKF